MKHVGSLPKLRFDQILLFMVIQLFNPVSYLRLVANMILRNKAEVILRHTIFIAVLSILPKLNLLKRKEILSFEGYGYNYDSCFRYKPLLKKEYWAVTCYQLHYFKNYPPQSEIQNGIPSSFCTVSQSTYVLQSQFTFYGLF